ncbi:hypothetical protein P7K49_002047, partial [Saguinus oedipus]
LGGGRSESQQELKAQALSLSDKVIMLSWASRNSLLPHQETAHWEAPSCGSPGPGSPPCQPSFNDPPESFHCGPGDWHRQASRATQWPAHPRQGCRRGCRPGSCHVKARATPGRVEVGRVGLALHLLTLGPAAMPTHLGDMPQPGPEDSLRQGLFSHGAPGGRS